MMKVLVSAFSNLYTDQRIEKVCETLHCNGYEIELIGNDWKGAEKMERPYPFSRIHLAAQNLKLGYPEFNYKLYKELLIKADLKTILLANDLDALLPNYLVSKKLNIPLVYDSHEIYTEMPAINGRFTQKIWRLLEKFLIPKVKYMMTASKSYGNWYQEKYGIPKPVTVQNFPRKNLSDEIIGEEMIPKIIIYQGAINPFRGLDKVIAAIKNIENAELWIVGDGPKKEDYLQLAKRFDLEEKVKFFGKKSPGELRELTKKADVGLSIEENEGESYYYSLPNKISDYIQAGVPVVVSNFPEMKWVVEHYQVGEIITNHSETELTEKISSVLNKGKAFYKVNLTTASKELCWENEEPKILGLFEKVRTENFH